MPIDDDEIDFGDVDFGAGSSEAPLTLDPGDGIDQVSPNPSYATDAGSDDGFEFDLDDIASDSGMAVDGMNMDFSDPPEADGGTMEVSVDQVEEMVPLLDDDELGEDLSFDAVSGSLEIRLKGLPQQWVLHLRELALRERDQLQ